MDAIITGLSIGQAALDWLTSGKKGEVLASFSQAVYLRAEDDEVYWIIGEKSPMHNRSLKISSPFPKMEAGSTINVRDGMLELPSGESMDFRQCPAWNPATLRRGDAINQEELGKLANLFFNQLLEQYQPAGMGSLIAGILRKIERASTATEFDNGNIFLKTSWRVVERIIPQLQTRDPHQLSETAMELAGLGEGLTPSGDDFLGGMIFCLHLLWKTYPETQDNFWNYSAFIEACKTRTNLISFTFMKEHANGHALEPLHKFTNALLEGQPIDTLMQYANEIIHVGHSTGWDMLTGTLVGMTIIFPG